MFDFGFEKRKRKKPNNDPSSPENNKADPNAFTLQDAAMWSSGGELKEDGGGGGGGGGGGRVGSVSSHWYWGGAGAAQLIWGISSYRKGVAGDGRLMPFKAFAVATLFVGAAASATMASFKSFGIHSIDDMKAFGRT